MVLTIEELNKIHAAKKTKEFKLLEFLRKKPGLAFSKKDLSKALKMAPGTINSYLCLIDKKSEEVKFKTVQGKRYYYVDIGDRKNGVCAESD